MNDDLDFYLSRDIKNWAARHPLPKGGQERLLRAAAYISPQQEQSFRFPLVDLIIKYFAPQTHGYQFISPFDEVIAKPFTQTQLWSWEFASTWRIAS